MEPTWLRWQLIPGVRSLSGAAKMNLSASKRPTGITITAWLWIVMGILMVPTGLMGGFAYSTMQHMGPPPTVPPDMPPGFALMTGMFRYFGFLLIAQTVVAILAIWGGIALLKLKAWARTTIEVLSWLTLLYCLGFGIFWIYLWISMTGQMPKGGAPVDTNMFQIMGAVMGLVITAVFAVPLWIMIRYLRGAEVRTAIQMAQPPNA